MALQIAHFKGPDQSFGTKVEMALQNGLFAGPISWAIFIGQSILAQDCWPIKDGPAIWAIFVEFGWEIKCEARIGQYKGPFSTKERWPCDIGQL